MRNILKNILGIVLLIAGLYLVLTTQVMAQQESSLIFSDNFEKPSINPAKWKKSPAYVYPHLGSLSFHNSDGPYIWGNAAIYSNNTFASKPGRTLSAMLRPNVFDTEGPYSLFSPVSFPSNPVNNSLGTGFGSFGGNGGRDLKVGAVVPGKIFSYGEIVEGNNYLAVTTLRPTGSYHFVSGGEFGIFPSATLVWVNNNPLNGPFYLGVDNVQTSSYLADTKLTDLTGNFTTQYGFARAVDSFNRPDSNSLGNTEVGNIAWNGSNVKISANLLVSNDKTATASASLNPGVSSGIFELDFKTPQASSSALSFYFRKKDDANWWRVRCDADSVYIDKSSSGVIETVVDQFKIATFPDNARLRLNLKPISCRENKDYHLVLVTNGPAMAVWLNNENIIAKDPVFTDPFLSNETNIQIDIDPGDNQPSVQKIAVWPKNVTLPSILGPWLTIPQPGANVMIEDNFVDTSGKRLKDHLPVKGGVWTEVAGEWVINENAVKPAYAAQPTTVATIDSGTVDHAITMTVNLSSGSGWGVTNGWEIGPILRYKDRDNYVWARYLYQNGSPEIELWEYRNGVGAFLSAKNITGLVAAGETHTMKAIILGKKVAIYNDDKLVIESEVTLLTGTTVGMVMDNQPINISSVESFSVSNAVGDILPPYEVDDLNYSISGSGVYLAFTPVNDDASGVKFYRVYRSTDGSVGTQINKDGDTKTTPYIDSSNPPTGKYYYTIRAVDNAGNENTSSLNKQISVDYTYVHPSPPGPTLPIPVNLVLNSSFETVSGDFAANWPRQNNTWRDSNNYHSGHASFGMNGFSTGVNSYYTYQTPQLVPNTKYVLSGWIKTNNVTGDGVTLRYAQTSPNVVIYQTQTLRLTNNWTYVSTTFTTPNDFQSGRLDILWNLKPGDMAFVDDVKLERITYPNLVKNPSFATLVDNKPASWSLEVGSTIDKVVKRTDSPSVKLTGPRDYTYSYQYLNLKPNTYYQLNYWIKTNNVTGLGLSMRYAVLNPANKYIFYTGWNKGTTNWRKMSTPFITPGDYKSGRLDIWWKLNTGDNAWIDDVSLCERECL